MMENKISSMDSLPFMPLDDCNVASFPGIPKLEVWRPGNEATRGQNKRTGARKLEYAGGT